MSAQLSSVVLEKIKLGFLQSIHPHLLEPEVSIGDDYFTGLLIANVTGFILGERGAKETIRYPADWWQALKERWFSLWAKVRWPVRWTVHEIDTKTLYPNFRVSMPRETHVLKFDVRKYNETVQ